MIRLVFFGVLLVALASPARALDFEVEPNDLANSATEIQLGQEVSGNVSSAADSDYFAVNSGSNSSLRIYFSRPSHGYQYVIATVRVLDGLTELSSVEIYAPDALTVFDVGVSPQADLRIQVVGCQLDEPNQCGYMRSERYDLMAIGLPSPTFESEPNNAPGAADLVSPNAWIFAQHSAKTDVDVFEVDVPAAGDLFVSVTRPTDSYQYNLGRIEVLDEFGSVLNGDDIYAPEGIGRVVIGFTSPAKVFIRMTSCSSGSRCDVTYSNQYQIASSFRPATTCELFQDGFDCPAP